MTLQKYTPLQTKKRQRNLWFERGMAILAATNLALVFFDLTYVSWRNFWLQSNVVIPITRQRIHIPFPTMDCPDRGVQRGQTPMTVEQSVITCIYDPIKGIEPHRDTEEYLRTVDRLEEQINQEGIRSGLKSAAVQETLAKLRQQSETMITQNPFQVANKSGTLETIKRKMRQRVGDRMKVEVSATEAFKIFWSTDNPTYPNYLSTETFSKELQWFNNELRPLIATNYFRSIGENGEPTNNFWLLDAPFVILFFLEFLARTFYVSRRYRSLNWLDAMVWRWYDIPLFLPFSLFIPVLLLTRIIPTGLRLHQAKLMDLHAVNARVREGFVAAIAEEITEVVIVQIVNQVQSTIRRGELAELLAHTTARPYIDINDINEVEEISKQLIGLVTYQVFPKIKPDLEKLICHSVTTIFNQSPVYQGITSLPGVGNVPGQITERLVTDLTQALYDSAKAALEDEKAAELTAQLVRNFMSTMISEAQQQNSLEEIQTLLSDLLEEIKINYIQRLCEEDATLILDETRQLKQRINQQ